MQRWLFIPALLLALTACSADSNADDARPTEIRVVTIEPTIEALQATIDAQATQISVLSGTATAMSQLVSVPTATTIGTGTVISETAVILSEASAEAEELGSVPRDASVQILEQTAPDRLGLVFYRVQYADLTGWVASPQLQVMLTAAATTAPTNTEAVAALPSETPAASTTPIIAAPTATTPPGTPLPEGFPTPQIYSVTLVEQLFEGGRMIWFEPNRQIWVLTGTEDMVDPTSGDWRCFDDTFVDGEPERLATMDPPMGTANTSSVSGSSLMQPVRGFGKIWRDNPDVRELLGWALLPETLHATRFEYVPGGEMVDGEYEAADGLYRIDSLYEYTIILEGDTIETPCEDKEGTWRIQE